jgi:hypothetical protein
MAVWRTIVFLMAAAALAALLLASPISADRSSEVESRSSLELAGEDELDTASGEDTEDEAESDAEEDAEEDAEAEADDEGEAEGEAADGTMPKVVLDAIMKAANSGSTNAVAATKFLDPAITGMSAAVLTALRDRYKVGSIRVATLESQAAEIAMFSGGKLTKDAVKPMLTELGWTAWAPSGSSIFWTRLVNAFAKYERNFGKAPIIKEIVCYAQGFDLNREETGIRAVQLVASYAAGSLAVYSLAELTKPKGGIDAVPWNVAQYPTSRSGPFPKKRDAVIKYRTYDDAALFILVHELTHAFLEKPSADVSSIGWEGFLKFRATVGWNERGNTLYDCGANGFSSQITASTSTSDLKEIYPAKWNDGSYTEQPISSYAMSNAMEDFCDSVAAYLYNPLILKARAPVRNAIIEKLAADARAATP